MGRDCLRNIANLGFTWSYHRAVEDIMISWQKVWWRVTPAVSMI